MQQTGYMILNGKKVLVLERCKKHNFPYHNLFKLRKSGKDGQHCTDEECFLNMPEHASLIEKLLSGETIDV